MTVFLDFQDQKTSASVHPKGDATQQLFAKNGTLQGRARSLRADPFAPAVGRQRTLVVQRGREIAARPGRGRQMDTLLSRSSQRSRAEVLRADGVQVRDPPVGVVYGGRPAHSAMILNNIMIIIIDFDYLSV